jgi:FAD/FMN-containing dehydrogenase
MSTATAEHSSRTATLIDALRDIVGQAYILTDEQDMAPRLTDWRGRYHGKSLCIVRPANAAQAAQLVACCAHAGVALTPQGGNTGLCGGATPMNGEVLITLERLNQIQTLDTDNYTLTAGAGCTLQALQTAAAQAQRLFPLSLASEGSATLGGALATNAGGVHVLRYGNARNLCLGLEVILPDGQIWNGLRALRKDNAGYALKHLFIGAEGTLGLITAATVQLFPQPRHHALAWVGVNTIAAALRLLERLRQRAAERVNAFELIDAQALGLVLRHCAGTRTPIDAQTPWHVLIELADTADPIQSLLENTVEAALEAGEVNDAVFAGNLAQSQSLWSLRERISEAQQREGTSIKHDISLPTSAIPHFIESCTAALEAHFPGLRILCFGHLGDGNLHLNLSHPQPAEQERLMAQSEQARRIVHDLVLDNHGSIAAEHGIGQLKRDELRRTQNPVERALMTTLKKSLDPQGLMNPGKVL